MSNALQVRLKNEYSTQYVLVIGKDSFYPTYSLLSDEQQANQLKAEKISKSAVAGLNFQVGGSSPPPPPTKIDPLRQASGKMYTKDSTGLGFSSTKLGFLGYKNIRYGSLVKNSTQPLSEKDIFYADGDIVLPDSYEDFIRTGSGLKNGFIPGTSQADGTRIRYQDVSDQWSEFFDTDVYPETLNLKRKATRLKVKFKKQLDKGENKDLGGLLQSRLTMLSLLTDINKKNKTVAYQDLAQDAIAAKQAEIDALQEPEFAGASLEDEINQLKSNIENIGDNIPTSGKIPGLGYDAEFLLPTAIATNGVGPLGEFPEGWSGDSLEAKINDYDAIFEAGDEKSFWLDKDNYKVVVKPDIPGTGLQPGQYQDGKELADTLYRSLIWTRSFADSQNADPTIKETLKTADDSGILSSTGLFGSDEIVKKVKNLVFDLMDYYTKEILDTNNESVKSYYPTGLQVLRLSTPDIYSPKPTQEELNNGFTIEKFKEWLLYTKIVPMQNALAIVEKQQQLSPLNALFAAEQTEFDQTVADKQEELAVLSGLYLTFQPASYDYNYDAVIAKENLKISADEYETLGDAIYGDGNEASDPNPTALHAINLWEGLSLNALNQSVLNGQLDSFYNASTGDYSHDVRTMYRDSPFMMQLPMSPLAMTLVNTVDKNELFIDVKSRYNYYSKFYEEGTKQTTVFDTSKIERQFTERNMPLLYDVPLDKNPDGTPADEAVTPLPTKFKFDKFGHGLLNCGYDYDEAENLKNLNIIVDQNSQDFLKKYGNIKTQFPFYVDFNFKSDANREFATLFNSTGMTRMLISTWITNFFYSNENARFVDKSDPITSKQANRYYNPLDSVQEYRDFPNQAGAKIPTICLKEIYKIDTTKDFYRIIKPETSADVSEVGGVGTIRETNPVYNTREFDLNKWLNEFVKYVAGESTDYFIPNCVGVKWGNTVPAPGLESNAYSKTFSDSEEFFNSPDELGQTLKTVIFLGKYRQLVDQTSRNYMNITNEELSYSETLFYRIEKRAVDSDTPNNIIQNFWLIKPNEKEDGTSTDIMRYIDTQVRHDVDYEYTVYAYQLVVGTRYGFQFENNSAQEGLNQKFNKYKQSIEESATEEGSYEPSSETAYRSPDGSFKNTFFKLAGSSTEVSNLHNEDDSPRLAIFDVVCEPDVKLVEMPFYKKRVVIGDAASTAPEVEIVPLRGQDNNIKINFYPSSVGRELKPVHIFGDLEGQELEKYAKIRKSQDRDLVTMEYAEELEAKVALGFPDDMPIADPEVYVQPRLAFQADDFAINYEIFRFENPPTTPVEVANGFLTSMSAQELSSYIDTIEHNKKYYYLFRSIDVHGNPSYPSPIYQVEMVENSGAVYPVISIYEAEPTKIGSKTKSFKRHLKIDAATMQGVLDTSNLIGINSATNQALQTPGRIELGEKDKKLFTGSNSETHKKFKFRVKSKHTGKIVDLNVSFKLRLKQPEEVIACNDEVTSQAGAANTEQATTQDEVMKEFP